MKPWREIIVPYPDLLNGTVQKPALTAVAVPNVPQGESVQ